MKTSTPEVQSEYRRLLAALDQCMLEDRHPLRRKIFAARNKGKFLENVGRQVEASLARVIRREERAPACHLPADLPISQHGDDLVKLIRQHQVLVVCGETGSGKSTQLPKICLRAGFGRKGMICQTQPRRIAARSVAERIAEELGSVAGVEVGYRVRFSEQISDQNYIRVLTDGMLLAEFEFDRFLTRYEVLIIDEAHERSLNVDFLLGVTRQILAKRPEFRLIITSATLDSEKFRNHFGDAPSIKVSGRTWPVELQYRPLDNQSGTDDALATAIYQGVTILNQHSPGDILVFLPGEREIRETANWLRKRINQGAEILPLYARLTPKEQHRIFHPGSRPRIILSTNVAETSLTVPGIKYVIDSGLARVSRYSPSRKIQRLPVEKISQSSAQQRAGRCGRVSSGICIRLYDEDDFVNRPEYTDPEILRTSLADVILRLISMGLGELDRFPFIDKPSRKQINDGIHQLIELGAIDENRKITRVGRQIAKMPVDPRIARVLLGAREYNCLQEMVIVAAALSVPDPRQNPPDKLQHARQVHRELSAESSDFLVMLDIWKQYRRIQKTESKRQAYRWCENNFLSIFRMREWGALQANIKSTLKSLGFQSNTDEANPDNIHRALLPGLLSNVARLNRDGNVTQDRRGPTPKGKRRGTEYLGTFGKSVKIFPGSNLKDKTPQWIMCAELVETGQIFARMVNNIQPGWIESAAQHLLQFHYSEPRWDVSQQRVIASRRATLYGLTIYSGRKCHYDKVNPGDCRQIFIRTSLVDAGLKPALDFIQHNRLLVQEIEVMERKIRRRDILVDEQEIFSFYDGLIPDWVNSGSSLKKWYGRLNEQETKQLKMSRQEIMLAPVEHLRETFPDEIVSNGIRVPLSYKFDPGSSQDGVTASIRLSLLNQIELTDFDRLVPGLLREKLIAMVRSLPKVMRRQLVPIPDTVDLVAEQIMNSRFPLAQALAESLNQIKSLEIAATDFTTSIPQTYLNMGFELIGDEGQPIVFDRDLDRLASEYSSRAQTSFAAMIGNDIERQGIRSWDFDDLEESVSVRSGRDTYCAYLGLVDCQDSVAIQLFDSRPEANSAHREGVRRLLWMSTPSHRKLHKKPMPEWQKISLMYASIGDLSELQDEMFRKAQDRVYFDNEEPIRSRARFDQVLLAGSAELQQTLADIAGWVAATLTEYRVLRNSIETHRTALPNQIVLDILAQHERLVYPGFVADTPIHWLPHLPRYLKALSVRHEQAVLDPATDQLRQHKVSPWWQQYLAWSGDNNTALEQYRWLVEEYRVSVFAQGLGTSVRISATRLRHAWSKVGDHSGH